MKNHPEVLVWVKPNNPTVTIIKNLWRSQLGNMLMGITLILWGLCMTRILMVGGLNMGGIKLGEKIEIVEHLSTEEIRTIEAAKEAKDAASTRKGIEANLKWRKEQGFPID